LFARISRARVDCAAPDVEREIAQRPEHGVAREVYPSALQLRSVQRPSFVALAGACVGGPDARRRAQVRGAHVMALVLLGQCKVSFRNLRAEEEMRIHPLDEPGHHRGLWRGPVSPIEFESAHRPGVERQRSWGGPGALRVPAPRVDRQPLAVADALDVALPDPGGSAFLFYCRQVVARAAPAPDRRIVGGAGRLGRL
jgi:hypothetical protein